MKYPFLFAMEKLQFQSKHYSGFLFFAYGIQPCCKTLCYKKIPLFLEKPKVFLKMRHKNVTAQLNYTQVYLSKTSARQHFPKEASWFFPRSVYPTEFICTFNQACITVAHTLPLVNSWFLSCMSHFSPPVPSSVFSCLTVPLQDQTNATSKGSALESHTFSLVWT